MKTYAVFPGLEALQQASKTRRWLTVPDVDRTMNEVSGYLAKLTGKPEDIAKFLLENSRPYRADMDRLFIAHTAIQVGITRAVLRHRQLDGLAGCSMGDFARSVIGGSTTLEQIIGIVWHLARYRSLSPAGELSSVRPIEANFSPAQLEWLKTTGISHSLWSERYGALSGTVEEIEAIKPDAKRLGLKIRKMYPYPFHSHLMTPVADSIRSLVSGWKIDPPSIPVYSSVFLRYLETGEDIREEALAGASSPIHWFDTIRNLRDQYGVRRLINIGPTDTITGWIEESQDYGDIEVIDAWEICREDAVELAST